MLFGLVLACGMANAQLPSLFNNRNASKFYKIKYWESGGSRDIYMSGADTATTDTMVIAGYPIQNYLWKMSQENDSVTVQCSLFVSLDGTTFFAGNDVDGGTAWASIFDTTAKDTSFQSISIPPCYSAYAKYISNASTGDSALIRSGFFLVPRGE